MRRVTRWHTHRVMRAAVASWINYIEWCAFKHRRLRRAYRCSGCAVVATMLPTCLGTRVSTVAKSVLTSVGR